jgi:hypothetical protein
MISRARSSRRGPIGCLTPDLSQARMERRTRSKTLSCIRARPRRHSSSAFSKASAESRPSAGAMTTASTGWSKPMISLPGSRRSSPKEREIRHVPVLRAPLGGHIAARG